MNIQERLLTKTSNHIMLDIETLDTVNSSVILQITMVAFEINKKYNDLKDIDNSCLVNIFPSLQEQITENRTMSPGTVAWWLGNKNIKKLAEIRQNKQTTLEESRDILKDILRTIKSAGMHVWARSPKFDIAILQDFLGPDVPEICIRHQRDVREYEFLSGKKPGASHDALEDCFEQIKFVTTILSQIFVTNFDTNTYTK